MEEIVVRNEDKKERRQFIYAFISKDQDYKVQRSNHTGAKRQFKGKKSSLNGTFFLHLEPGRNKKDSTLWRSHGVSWLHFTIVKEEYII